MLESPGGEHQSELSSRILKSARPFFPEENKFLGANATMKMTVCPVGF